MKKWTLVVIAVVYIASIVFISLFGLKAVVYNEVIPVTAIECLNESDDKTEVYFSSDIKVIKVPFLKPGNIENLSGTMVQLTQRVLPDNASNKGVKYVYNDNENVEFVQGEDGRALGLVIIKGRVVLKVKIMAVDGSKVFTEVVIWAY